VKSGNDRTLLDKIAAEVVQRNLTSVAILFFTASKPVAFIGASLLVFFKPILQIVAPSESVFRFIDLMHDRDNVEYLIQSIERQDREHRQGKN